MPAKALPKFFSNAVSKARRFYLDLAPCETAGLAVVCGGYEETTPDYSVHRETFPYYSIEFVADGRGELDLCGERYELARGVAFAYGPGAPHAIRASAGSRLEKYFVDFVGGEAPRLIRDAALEVGGVSRVDPVSEVVLFFSELIRDGLRNDPTTPDLCSALLRCIALRLAANRVRAAAGVGRGAYETYRRCADYIDANAANLASQQQAATACGVSPAYLSRLFKAYGRLSAHQYLTRLRMNIAAESLRNTTRQVQEIASELGFTDPFHFSRTFKHTFGISPRAFRTLR